MSVTSITQKFLESHPSIMDCMKKKLLNYSSVSRLIIQEHNLKKADFDAVLIALRRSSQKMKQYIPQEDEIISLLKKSTIEVKNKISVAVVDHAANDEDLITIEKQAKKTRKVYYEIEGSEVITLVISENLILDIKKTFKSDIVQILNGLALVIIQSPKEIEETVGSLAFISALLAHNNINIIETMSCWSETLLVVKEEDIGQVLMLLSF